MVFGIFKNNNLVSYRKQIGLSVYIFSIFYSSLPGINALTVLVKNNFDGYKTRNKRRKHIDIVRLCELIS